MKYKAIKNAVYDETGKQMCVILPTNCFKKDAVAIAKMAAEYLNDKPIFIKAPKVN